MFNRSLLAKLNRYAWKVLNLYLTQAVPYDDAKAGAAIACMMVKLEEAQIRLDVFMKYEILRFCRNRLKF